MKRILLTGFCLLSAALAQTPPAPVVPGAVLQQRFYWTAGIAGGPVVKNAPYSAEAVTETTQTLGDGNRIVQRTTQKLYRDSDGRERREESPLALGALAQPDSARVITISDPVAGNAFTLNPDTRIARQTLRLAAGANGWAFANVNAVLTGLNGNSITTYGTAVLPAGTQSAKEDLGSKNIEGVNARGTRETQTIPAGAVGNQFPIKVTDEVWFSSELQMNMLTTHNDPRSGEIVYKLTNVSRANPPKSLFEVPSDYTIQTGPAAGGRGGRGTPGNPPTGGGRSLNPQK